MATNPPLQWIAQENFLEKSWGQGPLCPLSVGPEIMFKGPCDMGVSALLSPRLWRFQRRLGLWTPQLIDGDGQMEKIKALLNMGEDIAHIHPNVNKAD